VLRRSVETPCRQLISFHLPLTNNRGDEALGNTWSYLDITALGRQEEWEDSPDGYPQTPAYQWWNWHDNYTSPPDRGWSDTVERGVAGFTTEDAH
jgi:hypothetical protein